MRTESGSDFFSDSTKTSRKADREYWYMELTRAISDRTKNRMAPLLAAGRYPSRSLSMSRAVFSASLSFSVT
jgi:hypothetical protein